MKGRKSRIRKKNSLYLEFLLLLAAAGAAGILFFLGAGFVLMSRIESYWGNGNREKLYNDKKIELLQRYVSDNQVSVGDRDRLDAWCGRNQEVFLEIVKGNTLLYSSAYGDYGEYAAYDYEDIAEQEHEEPLYHEDRLYEVAFADGKYQVYIWGMYAYSSYVTMIIADMALSVIVFVAVMLLGIRRKIRYINQLGGDVQVLEGGNLEHEVEVRGNDEIAVLAGGINAMRVSLNRQIARTEEALKANRMMVTEISHDLRTPLTSILLYSEILQNEKIGEDAQRKQYLEKMVRKVQHMKSLSDHLLEYSLGGMEKSGEKAEYLPCRQLLFDGLSDMCTYLEAQGFAVRTNMQWKPCRILAKEEYMARILDNVSSNFLKYADREEEILIWDEYGRDKMHLVFENSISRKKAQDDTHEVGLQSIRAMLAETGGACGIMQDGNIYQMRLVFACHREL